MKQILYGVAAVTYDVVTCSAQYLTAQESYRSFPKMSKLLMLYAGVMLMCIWTVLFTSLKLSSPSAGEPIPDAVRITALLVVLSFFMECIRWIGGWSRILNRSSEYARRLFEILIQTCFECLVVVALCRA